MGLDDANFILLNELKKPVKEQDKALILKGSWNIVTRLSYVFIILKWYGIALPGKKEYGSN